MVRFIVNGIFCGKRKLKKALRKYASLNENADIRVSWSPNDIKEFVLEAINYERLILVGDDGTINLALQALSDSEKLPPIGLVPTGNQSKFSKAVNLPKNIDQCFEFALNGQSVKTDVIKINDKYFLNNAFVGHNIRVNSTVPEIIDKNIGELVSSLSTFISFFGNQPSPVLTDIRDSENKYIFACISNGFSFEKGYQPTETANNSDGMMEVTLVKKVDHGEAFQTAYDFFKNRENKNIIKIKTKKLQLRSNNEVHAKVDGYRTKLSNDLKFECFYKKLDLVYPTRYKIFNTGFDTILNKSAS